MMKRPLCYQVIWGCAAVFCLAVPASPAAAQRPAELSCLLRTKDREVRWDKFWQKDLADDNVFYRVLSVEEINKRHEPRKIEIKLQAAGAAARRERTAHIILEHAAKMFCERIVGGLDNKKLVMALGPEESARSGGKEITNVFPSQEVLPEDLVFRAWHRGKWVPAKPRMGEDLFVCQTPLGLCSCNGKDHKMVQGSFKREGRTPSPRYKMLLPAPFIRHTQRGWRRADPVGLALDATIADCEVAGRKFSCLTNEKEAYRAELKDLEKEIALEQKLFSKAGAGTKEEPRGRRHKEQ